ncbi:MraY family glycosyltransferase [Desulfobulbus elongatus]|uniref:MraY family glycosyltransferase n=1 Tax=Desulfobulbus elongatus TaxID=53332 RepID=UPI0004800B84|nr:MraY family glycosyltransferase [Desulfobulbus elongatus]
MAHFSTLLLSMFSTMGLIPLLACMASRLQMLDPPGERKIHASPVPRVGGLAMAIGVLPPIFLHNHLSHFAFVVLAGAAIIILFAVIDDSVGLGYKTKFTGQIAAAMVVIFYGKLSISSFGALPDAILSFNWIAIPLTLLVILAVTNAVNLADGLDGLAGGMMAQVFLYLTLLAYRCDVPFISLFAIAVVGAIFGFLRFNTFPASIFMGDTGSQLLGFLGIVLTLALTQGTNALSPLIPMLLFCFPVLDTAVVMFERIRRGNSPFLADKNHFHHKLIRMGLYHTEAVLVVYAIQAFFVVSAYLLRFSSEWLILVYCFAAIFLIPMPIYVLHGTGFRFRRLGFIDIQIKTRLRKVFKERLLVLRLAQGTLEYGLPLLFLGTVFLPGSIAPITGIAGGILLCAMTMVLLWKTPWTAPVIRVAVYVLCPLIFLHCQQGIAPWITSFSFGLYSGLYGLMAFAAIAVLKLTRRQKGFRLTPTDFLIVLIVLVVPNLPDPVIEGLQLGVWTTFLIVFFFSVELLIGELRGVTNRLGIALMPALAVLLLRGALQGTVG